MVLRKLLTGLILIVHSGWAAAQPTPQLVALSVKSDGSVTASWTIPAGSFDGFRLYYRPSGTSIPYFSIDFSSSETGGVVPVTDAMTTGYEAFLTTFLGTDVSDESGTLRTILLSVSNAGSGTGIARLDWNKMNAAVAEVYSIQRSDDGITYNPAGETAQQFFYDTIQRYCNPVTIYYKVIAGQGMLDAASSVSSGIFEDDNLPEDPVLSYVTIVDGKAEVHWAHSPTPDVSGYVIGVKEGPNFNDHTTTGYTDFFTDDLTALPTYHDPCNEVVTYVMRAIDQCGNSSSGAVNYLKPHNTILISGDTETLCNRKASLSWNSYKNMMPPVSAYIVMRSFNGGPPVEVGSVPAGTAANYTFIDDELLEPGGSYTYFVRGVNQDNTLSSESCRLELFPDPEQLTAFALDNLTVLNNERIDLYLSGSPASLIAEIEVLRSSEGPALLQPLVRTGWGAGSSLILPEPTAEVTGSSYYYRVVALDPCGFELASSEVMRSIFLELTDMGSGNIRLNWNAIEGWPDGPVAYNVYRFDNGQPAAGFPQQVSPSVLFFNDYASGAEAGRVTYYVEALRADDAVSRSNEVLLPGEADIRMPNAFRAGGLSQEFKPLVRNIEPGFYSMLIYNRWGQLVFETSDYTAGWDGSFNGQAAAAGIYAVIVRYRDFNGADYARKGFVMLFR